MRQAFLLLPNVAMLAVICRMANIGLHRSRTAMFFFVCSFFLFCLVTIVASQAASAKDYPALYFKLQVGVILTVFPALWIASRAIHGYAVFISIAAVLLAGFLAPQFHWSIAPLLFMAAFGIWFLVSSIGAADVDAILWAGVGGFLFVNGAGILLVNKFRMAPSGYELVALACAAIWIALAWKIGPTHDAIINPEKLALTPFARIIFGIARSARG